MKSDFAEVSYSGAGFTFYVDDLVPTLRARVERMTGEERRELRRTVPPLLSGWRIRELELVRISCSRVEADLERVIIGRLLYPNLDIRGELLTV